LKPQTDPTLLTVSERFWSLKGHKRSKTLIERLWNAYGTLMGRSGTFRNDQRVLGTFWNAYGAFRNAYGTLRNVQERFWNVHERSGTLMERSGTLMERSGTLRDIQERSETF
jgi:hypothetical protein